MTKQAEGVAEDQETEKGEETKKTDAELAAEARVAEAEKRATEKDAEVARLRQEMEKNKPVELTQPITVFSYSDNEWKSAEERTGKTRDQLVTEINQGINDKQVRKLEQNLQMQQTRLAIKEELNDALEADPLASKYRGEAKKFLADIPESILADPDSRKKWINKAVEFGKRSLKLPSETRRSAAMDTKESGKGEATRVEKDYTEDEKAVFEQHGKTAEDYEKIKHPYLPDAIMIKDRPEAPRFGPK